MKAVQALTEHPLDKLFEQVHGGTFEVVSNGEPNDLPLTHEDIYEEQK